MYTYEYTYVHIYAYIVWHPCTVGSKDGEMIYKFLEVFLQEN
jgi:hypothetical protein